MSTLFINGPLDGRRIQVERHEDGTLPNFVAERDDDGNVVHYSLADDGYTFVTG